ncbi:MAG: NADH-quinone oxidoreductase subunit E [Nitrospirales bacterium]|nr:MAG: NADH-quinone oxidoreductase subunit E [Nitrospirales bacterium]
MLTEAERHQIARESRQYPHKRAACLQALKIVQEREGWVSDEDLEAVAGCLDMTPAELDAVATFYNLIFRKPVGRHVILLCDSISCWVMGCTQLQTHFKSHQQLELGKTSANGRFTLLPIVCLGACDRAPAMMVDHEIYGNLTPENIDEILEQFE